MKFALVSLLALCISTVTFAQNSLDAGIASTHPPLGSVVPLGSNYTIEWAITDVNATTIEAISLLKGDPLSLTLITANILTNGSIPVSDLAYNWTVSTDLVAGTDYALSFIGNNSGTTYSPFFTIQ